MNHRRLIRLSALAGLLVCPSVAIARGPALAGDGAVVAHAAQGSVSGAIIAIEANDFTIQSQGHETGLVDALTDAADALTAQDYPYVWGGGHGEAGVASIGDRGGPGANGHTLGYDCSGAVAAVLAGAGLWRAGSWVPNDAGVIAQLLSQGVIAAGPGVPPDEVTLYDNPGVHIFMNIDGRFFGTSDGGAGGNSNGGAGWLDDDATDAYSRSFREYHIVPSVLRDQTSYGQDYTFQTLSDPDLVDGFLLGDEVTVGYRASAGAMTATSLGWVGQASVSATVNTVSAVSGQLVVETPGGQVLTMAAAADVAPELGAIAPGDTVTLVYTRSGSGLVLHRLTLTAVPPPPPPVPLPKTATGTITAIASNGASFTIETAAGHHHLKLSTDGVSGMLTGLAVGTPVEVIYTKAYDGATTATQVSPVETSSPTTDGGAPGASQPAAPGSSQPAASAG